MELKNIVFILFFLLSIAVFTWSCRKLIKYMLVAKKKDDRFDKIGERLNRVWVVAFAQTKLLRDPKAGILHLIIFSPHLLIKGLQIVFIWCYRSCDSGFLFSIFFLVYGYPLFCYDLCSGCFCYTYNYIMFICFIQKIHSAYTKT